MNCPRCKGAFKIFGGMHYTCEKCPKVQSFLNSNWIYLTLDDKLEICKVVITVPNWEIFIYLNDSHTNIISVLYDKFFKLPVATFDLIYKSDEEILSWIKTMLVLQ